MTSPPALELRGITKRFGRVTALSSVDFALEQGEVHALLGENGAGKSTLMHVAFGMVAADAGTMALAGSPARIRSPRDARRLGLGMVHQHFTSVPSMTVEENIWVAVGRYRADLAQLTTAPAREVVQRLWGELDPKARVETLTVALQQRLEILKALATDATILLLDEPTAVLAPSEIRALLETLRAFARAGGSVVLITHKLGEVLAAADRVTVLRQGTVTYTGSLEGQTVATLARAMIGEDASSQVFEGLAPPPVPAASGERAVAVRGLGFAVREGELVGVAAVEGNGQRELLRAIAGVDAHPIPVDVEGPVSFVPEDRRTEGLIPSFSLTENLVLGMPNDPRWRQGPWLRWPRAAGRMRELIGEFEIRAAGSQVPASSLSGGNQQKVVLARALESKPKVLVVENPTQGLDIRATADIHRRLRDAAADGAAVLVYSSDLDEVMALGQRVLVVHQGRVTEAPPGASREVVGELMLGVSSNG